MSQIRTFLIFAWLMVAAILWIEWGKEQNAKLVPPQSSTTATGTPTAPITATTPSPSGSVPQLPAQASAGPTVAAVASATASPATSNTTLTLGNDVLRLTLDGGNVRRAELLRFRTSRKPQAPHVRVFDDATDTYYVAQSGWSSASGAPTHNIGFVAEQAQREIMLADGADTASASFLWTGTNGVSIRRIYTLKRNDYALSVRDEVVNQGTQPWTGYVYRQLLRAPPQIDRGMTNPESFSFNGAAWYSPEHKYDKRTYDEFVDDGPINLTVAGGWVALLEHYFFTSWIPQADQQAHFSLTQQGQQSGIAATGPEFTVAPGTRISSEARLWVGPKLPEQLKATTPGLERALDYGVFTFIAEPIHWTLAQLHKLTNNWGWAIVLLVVLIKLLMYPLSAAQYKSMARMRKFQPRMQQIKERYGEDKQKYQMAIMELYKKEKINPAGGCWPLLIQMPVFLALYWVLIESVELRQAPWMLWIQDLTARDPLFILPIINIAIMWLTQKMTPMVGMDPVQQKMMQAMPLVFGVMFALFPAGLVLYWVTNGALGMLQQWWMIRQFGEKTSAKA